MSVPKHLRLAPEVEPRRVSATSGELAALVATPSAQEPRGTVLLVPGYTGSKEDFIHLLPLLARAGFLATAIDLRGQFESGGPEDEAAYSVAALAADVASLVPAAERWHLVGHSFGGLVCRQAVIAGAAARSLTLLCSGAAALGGNRGALIELMRPLLADGGVPAVWEASSSLPSDAGAPEVPPEVQDFLQRRFLASPAAALLGMGTALTTASDRVSELAATGVPLLVACGENDDAWSPAEQREMAQRLGAKYIEFAAAGHSPAVDDPDAVAAALVSFWSPT
jgi:pimeloyl-ACP methyl ester carboxylesterase